MTDKEKILTEIVRINDKNETYSNKDKDLINSSLYEDRKQVCQMLLDFINSLPLEKFSKDLEYLATSLERPLAHHLIQEKQLSLICNKLPNGRKNN